MKSLRPRYEMIISRLVLLVGQKRSLLTRDLFFDLLKTFFHYRGGYGRIFIMNGHLIQASVKEFPLDGRSHRVGQSSVGRCDLDDAQIGLFARNRDREIQGFIGSPRNQFFRRVSPIHPKWWLQKLLSMKRGDAQQQQQAGKISNSYLLHAGNDCDHSVACFKSFRKQRSWQPGMVLVEATAALSLLTIVGMILFTLTMNVITPRQYALQQVLSDAYLTFERAQAQRIPFETLISNDESPWPIFPDVDTEEIEIGKLPGGRVVEGSVTRTRFPDEANYPADGGSGDEDTNPAAMEIWRVQSVLRYTIADRTYVKSRTIIRAQ